MQLSWSFVIPKAQADLKESYQSAFREQKFIPKKKIV